MPSKQALNDDRKDRRELLQALENLTLNVRTVNRMDPQFHGSQLPIITGIIKQATKMLIEETENRKPF